MQFSRHARTSGEESPSSPVVAASSFVFCCYSQMFEDEKDGRLWKENVGIKPARRGCGGFLSKKWRETNVSKTRSAVAAGNTARNVLGRNILQGKSWQNSEARARSKHPESKQKSESFASSNIETGSWPIKSSWAKSSGSKELFSLPWTRSFGKQKITINLLLPVFSQSSLSTTYRLPYLSSAFLHAV